MTISKLLGFLISVFILAACGGGEEPIEREAQQSVHHPATRNLKPGALHKRAEVEIVNNGSTVMKVYLTAKIDVWFPNGVPKDEKVRAWINHQQCECIGVAKSADWTRTTTGTRGEVLKLRKTVLRIVPPKSRVIYSLTLQETDYIPPIGYSAATLTAVVK